MDGWFSNANSSINIELDKYQFTYMMNQINALYTILFLVDSLYPAWHGGDEAINCTPG